MHCPCSYASGDKEVVEEMNMVDAFGQLSVVALKVRWAAGKGQVPSMITTACTPLSV